MESTPAEGFLDRVINRAGPSEAVARIAQEVSRVFAADEVVLEAADCTAAGEYSAVFVTSRQLSVGVRPGQPHSVDLERLTSYSFDTDPDSSFRLVLRICEDKLTWAGFGPNGMQRISHALDWVFDHYRRAQLTHSADTSIGELYDAWGALQQEYAATPELSAAKRHTGLVDVSANKRWW